MSSLVIPDMKGASLVLVRYAFTISMLNGERAVQGRPKIY